MGGFSNPVVGGGGDLVRERIRSPDYQTGVQGWSINQDGSAEFNDLTARGTVVLDGSGTLLVYDSNDILIVAISPAGGTDSTGQTYDKGIDTYDVELGARTYQINTRDGVIIFNFEQSNVFLQRGLIQANEPLDAAVSPSLGMYAPSDNADQLQGAVVCYGTSQDATATHRVRITGIDPTIGNAATPTLLDVNGDISLPEGHYVERGGIARPTLLNGWSDFGSGVEGAGYIEHPDGTGGLVGTISGGTTTFGTVLFTMPALMWPSNDHVFPSSGNGGRDAQVIIQADGDVVLQNADSGLTWLTLDACRWPLAAAF